MTSNPGFEEKLARYAELLVRTGVNLPEGGKVQVNAPVEAAALARLVARAAYRAGATDVRVDYNDQHLALALYEDGTDAAVDFLPEWDAQESEHLVTDGYAFISILGSDPALLAGVNPDRVARRSKLSAQMSRHVQKAIGGFEVNWTVAAMSTPAWARRVYPDLPEEEAVARLWDDIFKVTRADLPDPVAAWDAHLSRLERLTEYLNGKQYAAIHFKSGLGTDLTVGLAENHIWQGGAETAKNGIRGVPNLPTDEVFTAPHRNRVDGVAVASKPLSLRGQLVEGIRVRFEGGKAVEVSADRGEETLKQLTLTDEGAAHLGEVALVPASAPVAQTGTLFLNTLFDENAASHIALGRCYPTNVQHGENPEALRAAGGNDSLIHVDWMIGTPDTDVDGITQGGQREALMRGGEWVVGELSAAGAKA
ncbi:aminopeptidase [Deinococcus metallilatus]|uniref:Aminopeptidase n=1 Tax=Deinococcus metallilatus TaxID=1211322 RepID=A0AAJ5F4L3_9DEIO|nr:aminopeptidase [Deinococcus metallilatus]MBB5294528.1 aminopeptidase [Deinococcus metallilatus]QBY07574.1 aminopeptidase [Deinococcus metallilatus]RXJ13990.1 aminopeptidase [Deinococcus metallilatus]TLK29955.1 aminopeptidase [Deinococcus metallilatus]GMA15742.1 aminopeptidase [Deinococcus metallilatus]